jgi:hypothetical protein
MTDKDLLVHGYGFADVYTTADSIIILSTMLKQPELRCSIEKMFEL